MKNELQVYLGGDILSAGSYLLRDIQRDEINKINGVTCYSPKDDASINDKANAVQEGLAERILHNDYYAMYNSDVYTFDVENTAVGTVCEIGIILGMKRHAQKVIDSAIETAVGIGCELEDIMKDEEFVRESLEIVNRPVLCYCSDLRQGHGKPYLNPDRAEYSINQFVLGAALELTDGEGLISWQEVLKRLEKLGESNV